ncbi:serine/threonineprotein kinase, putative [Acanthamoeba castellanii str. Neff]|uniref:non-specific serine/threonine protein kinase n=1 Tax=Acanthamoeba castellanii (strain ATCC 30010 / Neff) TaxID=1257118 RepID=L8GXG2_ACACF|nr:serine/threonineprotein kinase, putative [Acanthamoeba castellanii str. Neff]ELR17959.1 serine/threonineprotein kinase, putative [Acanthamoeba castellanii str. Neff]
MADEGLISNLDEAWNINYEDLDFGKEIGKGGFGSVYEGEYFGTPVAIKKIVEEDPDGLLYLEREVNVLKGMRHPNIVQFIGIAVHEGALFIITEYVDNGNLRKFLKDSKIVRHGIPSQPCKNWYLHSRNVIHRDLKSKNLLVGDNWRLKICDFGFARVNASNRPMTLCGTDDWMAPEMIMGFQYDNKVDVFSYGIVLCELITRAKISDHLQRKPQEAFGLNVSQLEKLIPADCPPEFAQVAIDCCGYEPSARPSFKDVIRRLKPIMKTLPPWNPSATPTAAPPAPYSPVSRTQAAPARPAPTKAPAIKAPTPTASPPRSPNPSAAPKFTPPAAAQARPASPAAASAASRSNGTPSSPLVSNRSATIAPNKALTPPTVVSAPATSRASPAPTGGFGSSPSGSRATPSAGLGSGASGSRPQPVAAAPKPTPVAAAAAPKPAPATAASPAAGGFDANGNPRSSVRYAGVRLKKTGGHGLW